MPDGHYFSTSSTTRISSFRQVVQNDPDFEWYRASKHTLNYLTQLPVGWDGHRATAVSLINAIFALDILKQICIEDTPPPHIAPGVNGNCQLEWHTLNGDLELNVKALNQVEVYYSVLSENPPIEQELTLRNDFTGIVDILRQITGSAIAHAAAA